MSLKKGVLTPAREETMFIGYAHTPRIDQFFLSAVLPLMFVIVFHVGKIMGSLL